MKGYRTYIVAVCIGVVAMLQALDLIDSRASESLYVLLGAGGLATLRAGVA